MVHFHQLILGNVSYAVLLLVIRFLNDLKIAQYEIFPSSLFWRTEGELTLFCFAGARSHTAFRCSGAGTSYWCQQRQHDEGAWSEPELKEALAIVGATGSRGMHGSHVSAGHSRTVHLNADLPPCYFYSLLRGLPSQCAYGPLMLIMLKLLSVNCSNTH